MIPTQTLTEFPVFSDNGTKAQPGEAKYAAGFANADVLPYEWVNWFFNKASAGVTGLNAGVSAIEAEINSVLSSAGITPSTATTNQLLSAIQYLLQAKTGTLANLTTTDKTTLVAAINEIKAGLGSAAGKTAGSAAGNVPLIDTALTTNSGTFVTTTAEGKLKNSGVPAGTAAGKNVDTTASQTSVNLPTTGMAISCGNAGAICNTEANIQVKEISLNGFALFEGVTVKVLFTNANTAATPSLNVSETGAKAIKAVRAGEKIEPVNHSGKWRGASDYTDEMWQPYTTLELMYDGTDWVIMGNPLFESYVASDGSKGYSVYSDGKIEQWGKDISSGTLYWTVVFSTSDYFCTAIGNTSDTTRNYGADTHTTSSVKFYCRNSGNRYYAYGY